MSVDDNLHANFHVGDVLSGYQLVEIIGQGSSGTVWRAQSDKQSVAIKVMHSHLLERERSHIHLYQFQQEVKALATLISHPRVPRILAVELKTDPPYFVMSLALGQSFEEELISGVMMLRPIKARLKVLSIVAETIDFVHQHGILHRDIKPGNIRGWHKPYLVDFSISSQLDKLHEVDPHHGTSLYKPPYPDYRLGIFDDIFAFAVVCFQVIFNRHPIVSLSELSDNLVETMNQKLLSGTWHKPTQLSSEQIPSFLRGANLEALDNVFARAFYPKIRYATVQQIVESLSDIILDIDNADYVDLVPDEKNLPTEMAQMLNSFTNNEISVNALDTDIKVKPACGQHIAFFINPFLALLRRFT